jgi:hypothetical protein
MERMGVTLSNDEAAAALTKLDASGDGQVFETSFMDAYDLYDPLFEGSLPS